LVLRADLLARQGDIEAARLAIERVLLRDIDWPGARERHRRWRRVESRVAPVARPEAVDLRLSPDKGLSFQIVREVARGGAGIVYEAIDRDLGRRVALKLYHRAERDRTQLRHEACVAVLLRGRGIVEVFDVNLDEGWLAMRWAPLGALGAHLHAQNTTVAESMGLWALTLARALGRVHAAGWVHHDVKPANVLLLGPGEALLTDFATARRMGDPSPRGSLGYVSPERLAGRPSDPKDDVYAFGRVIEAALETHTRQSAQYALFRQVVRSCTGPDADRPIDAGKVATELAAELREPAP
jgi:serine/threonine-protein kinase